MSLQMGGAHIDEHGNITGGAAGDQTGSEVCRRTWYVYKSGWSFIAYHPDANVREKHAQAVEQACDNDNVGYDQTIAENDGRNTLYKQAKLVDWIIKNIKTKCECDCSSLQDVAAICSGGVAASAYGSNGPATSGMRAWLKAAGYVIITASKYLSSSAYSLRGAIYVAEGHHTECALGNGSNYQDILAAGGVSGTASTSGGTSSGNSGTSNKDYVYTEKLDVDGEIGNKTVKRLQTLMGKKGTDNVDGFIDGQQSASKKYWSSILTEACKWTGGASPVVKSWQQFLKDKGYSPGTVDGKLGNKTALASQKFLIAKGYSCGKSGADGKFGKDSAMAFQKFLNANR